MGRLENKVAVVTGATTGIGLAAAVRLADEGAHVFLAGRNQIALDEAAAAIGADSATAIAGDISSPADIDRLYDAVASRGRGLDVLFANAATFANVRLEDGSEEDFDAVYDVNVRGTLLTVQKALPLLNEGASVILTGSTASELGIEGFTLYSSSKAAVRSFARTWANELKDRKVRVNVVSPGMVETPAVAKVFGADAAQKAMEDEAALTPTGRIGQPEEIAALVAFLASDESSYITGANMFADGGRSQI